MNNGYLISVDIEQSFFQQSYFLKEKPTAKVLQLMTVDLGAKFFSGAKGESYCQGINTDGSLYCL